MRIGRVYDLRTSLIIISIYMLVFNEGILNFGLWDELLPLVLMGLMIVIIVKNKIVRVDKKVLKAIICAVILLLTGLLSNYLYSYQEWKAVFADAFIMFKFFMCLISGYVVMDNYNLLAHERVILKHIKICIAVIFSLDVLDLILNINPVRYEDGMRQITLFYSHPTVLVANVVLLLAVYTAFINENKKGRYIFILMSCFVLLTTGVTKGYLAIILFVFLYLFVIKLPNKFKIWHLFAIAFVGIVVGWNELSFYILSANPDFARYVLLKTSLLIFYDYFPLGTGFGTFASYYSGVYYSPLYELYGISQVNGLIKGKALFIADSFWPMIIGQFGAIGTVVYIYIMYVIFSKIWKIKENAFGFVAAIMLFGYLLISSTSETGFNHSFATTFALMIAILLQQKEKC